jgi:hypothetical protein
MLSRRHRLIGVASPAATELRRAFRSEAALEAIRAHSKDADGPAHLALYNYPTFAGGYAALAADLFHRRLRRRLLVLPFSSVEPFRFPPSLVLPPILIGSCIRLSFLDVGVCVLEMEISKLIDRSIE